MASTIKRSVGSAQAVQVRDMSFSYGDYKAVKGVDLEVGSGQVHGLLGTNGAGKTTSLELIQGFRAPTGGQISVLGVDPRSNPGHVRRNTGVVLQEAGFYQEMSVECTIAMWASLSSRGDNVTRILKKVGLSQRASSRISTLSGGEKRRLDLALAIWGSPLLLILDEPTTGLDPESRSTLWEVVREMRSNGATILLTTHYLEEVEVLADTVSIMHQGQVAAAGTIEEVLSSRPSRIQAAIDGGVPEIWPPAPPHGVRVRWEAEILHVSSRDQQQALSWLIHTAEDCDVRFKWIRATPASLEEVFLGISRGTQTRETGSHDGRR